MVTKPSHSGSSGVTLTIMPARAYVLLPMTRHKTSRGIRKYSRLRARAKEFGGMMQESPFMSTKLRPVNAFGSTIALKTLVKTLNSSATRMSYPEDDTPYETTPFGQSDANGSIMPANAWAVIQMSDLIPISRLPMPIFACTRYHYVQTHNTVKHCRRQPTRRVQFPALASHSFYGQLPARTCPSTNQPDSTSVRPDITSLIVGVREVVLKQHRVPGFQQALHESRDLLERTD